MMSVNTAITIPEPTFSHYIFFVEFPASSLFQCFISPREVCQMVLWKTEEISHVNYALTHIVKKLQSSDDAIPMQKWYTKHINICL